jgi:hypothetical protein
VTPLSEAERVAIRRFCGYPTHSSGAVTLQAPLYYNSCGTLEFRIAALSAEEIAVARSYLASISALETAVPAAGETLSTSQAATWTRNKDELTEKLRLLDAWRRRLCGFLGIAPGPALSAGRGALVV